MPRWITVRQPFDYYWPDRMAVTHFGEPGEQFVKDEVADFAVEKGYASEGKLDGSARSKKSTGRRVTKRKGKAPAKTADTGTIAPVGDENAADADRAAGGSAMAPDAG
jgi:hypothetical protein